MNYNLPPIGQIGAENHADANAYIQGLCYEAQEARAEWLPIIDQNLEVYTYGSSPRKMGDYVTINEIQNAIIAVTDIQTKEPPACALEPVERGEPPICYWNGPQDVGMRLGLGPEQVTETLTQPGAPLEPPQPMTDDQADQIRDAIEAGVMLPGANGLPTKIRDRWFVEVNDQLVADVYQTVFDVMWARGRIDSWIRENLLDTNIMGYTFWLYEWDDAELKPIVREMSPKQVYVDPTQRKLERMSYVGLDLALDAAEAKALTPDLADIINESSQQGQLPRVDGVVSFGSAFNRNFRRDMVVKRVFWIRNQPCPYSPEDAVQQGLVVPQEVPDGGDTDDQFGKAGGNAGALRGPPSGGMENDGVRAGDQGGDAPGGLPRGGSPIPTGSEAGDATQAQGETPQVEEAEDANPSGGVRGTTGGLPAQTSGQAGEDTGPRGQPESGGDGSAPQNGVFPAQIQPTRTAYLHPATGEELDPSHPAWPTYPCTRQITQIGPVVVDDRVCEHWDIPILHNVNIPIPSRPWGIGEPFRLKALQDANSDVMDSMVKNARFFKAPVTVLSKSMKALLPPQYQDAHIHPGMVLTVPDDQWNMTKGVIHTIIEPPGLPPALANLQPLLNKEIADQSGFTEVLQGQPSPDVTSGRQALAYQQAGTSIIGFKSRRTEEFVYWLSRLMLHSIVTRMDMDQIAKIVRKYPPHILSTIFDRKDRLEWDVKVTIKSGSGAIQQANNAEAMQKFQLGLISKETAQERTGEDPRQEQGRQQKEAAQMMGAAGPAQPPAGTHGAPPAGGQPSMGPAGGNGRMMQ